MALRSAQLQGDDRLEAAAVSDAAHVKRGDRGDFVAKIQSALNVLDGSGLTEDGDFGSGTAKAVLAFKTVRGIINRAYQHTPDDIVGRLTIAALDDELARLAPPAIEPVVIIGKPGFTQFPRQNFALNAIGEGQQQPPPNPFKVTAVVRGNPFKTADAQPFPDLPASIPPHKTYQVDITVQPPLSSGDVVDIAIINTGADNGTATVSPSQLSTSGKVVVSADRQTLPGHAGQLRIQASLNGKILATSDGFSVCAHPSAVRIVSSSRLVDPTHIGIEVVVQIESDSGSVADLNEAVMNELVEEVLRDSPPFSKTGTTVGSPFYQKIGAGRGTDAHGFRPFPGTAGNLTVEQVHVFKCKRCGAAHIPMDASGFEINGRVFTDDKGKTWKLEVTRDPTKTGVRVSPEDGVARRIFKAGPGLGTKAKSNPPEVIVAPP